MVEKGYEIVWTKRAQKQMRQAFKHISKDSAKNASKVIQGIVDAVLKPFRILRYMDPTSIRLKMMVAIGL